MLLKIYQSVLVKSTHIFKWVMHTNVPDTIQDPYLLRCVSRAETCEVQ
jgi:hypothetical protein